MGQGLKGGPHTYAQFSDLVFGPLPPNSEGILRMTILIGKHENCSFQVFMDDHGASATGFDTLFKERQMTLEGNGHQILSPSVTHLCPLRQHAPV